MPIQRKTKIIVTLGESSSSKEILIDLIRAGMDIARISNRFLKFDKQQVLENLNEAMEETGIQVGVMLGLRESDIRIGTFTNIPMRLKTGDIVRISSNPDETDHFFTLWCNNKEFSTMVSPGDKLLVDFGKIILTVLENESFAFSDSPSSKSVNNLDEFQHDVEPDSCKVGNIMFILNSPNVLKSPEKKPKKGSLNSFQRPKRIVRKMQKSSKIVMCSVENDCSIQQNKPVHISSPGKLDTPLSDLTAPEDFKLIEWADENNIDFIVYKQVHNKEDLDFLLSLSSPSVKKILGLQNKSSLSMFEDLVNTTDGVVIGRGTLALETSLADVCRIQKQVVHRCNDLSKPVVISTQLLESMVSSSAPTRSEVTDITNAVLDGADALMLSGETAYGVDPVRAFHACVSICKEAEKYLDYIGQCEKIKKMLGSNITITENTCYSAVTTVISTWAKAIVCFTESGRTAQIISRFMPPCNIIALTNSQKTCRQMRIIRGVIPFYVTEELEVDLLQKMFEIIKSNQLGNIGDYIVVVGGHSINFEAGATCSLRIVVVK